MEYELYHHGILGMKWGIRRYQNEDGSLTPEGKKRLAERQVRIAKTIHKLKAAGEISSKKRLQKKAFRQIDSYAYLINRLAYNRMSDEEIINTLRNMRFNDSVPSIATDSNVGRGKSALSGVANYFSDLGTIGIGLKDAAAGAVGMVGLIKAIKALKKKKGE